MLIARHSKFLLRKIFYFNHNEFNTYFVLPISVYVISTAVFGTGNISHFKNGARMHFSYFIQNVKRIRLIVHQKVKKKVFRNVPKFSPSLF